MRTTAMEPEICVSVLYNTYNHAPYVAEAIKSFLMQRTNFTIEILIHDDASQDTTADIIRSYEQKYPDLIHPIYQKENQYSKHKNIWQINGVRAKGKFIALCDGDDYWTDPEKLQKQVDFLEAHTECSACFHASHAIHAKTGETLSETRLDHLSRPIGVEEIIARGGGFFSTNSILFRREICNEMPSFYQNAPVRDYPLMIVLALRGTVYYLDEFMSNYRRFVDQSWSSQMASSTRKRQEHIDAIEKMLVEINEYTQHRFSQTIENTIMKNRW